MTVHVKLDKNDVGIVHGIDIDVNIPHLLLKIDLRTVKGICQILDAYFISPTSSSQSNSIATNKNNSNNNNNSTIPTKGHAASATATGSSFFSKSEAMQDVLRSDPTLRTLLWLEQEENKIITIAKQQQQQQRGEGGRDSRASTSTVTSLPLGITDNDNIDLRKVAHLMTQVNIII